MSIAIYSSEKVMPYVYKGVHKETGQFYFGYRAANKVPSTLDLGLHYFTSSKSVKALGFENFEWVILAEFIKASDAYNFEQQSILDNWENPLKLNRHCDKNGKWTTADRPVTKETRLKIANANKGRKRSDAQIKNMSLLRSGKPQSEKHALSRATSRKQNNESWISEQVKEKIRKTLIGKKLPKRIISCPFCDKEGAANNMKRYHFENCKLRPL